MIENLTQAYVLTLDVSENRRDESCSAERLFTSLKYAYLSEDIVTWAAVYTSACERSYEAATTILLEIYNNATIGLPPNYILLTDTQLIVTVMGTITAPGNGRQAYEIFYIDTTYFPDGGTLTLDITLGMGESNASFDLFPEGAAIPLGGRPTESLIGRYDIVRGNRTFMTYSVTEAQIFQFGATGNWFSTEGSTNTYELTVTFIPN